MSITITADYLLATILSERSSVSFRELRAMQEKIEAAIPDVVVDITSPAVRAAFQYYPEIFEKRNGSVMRAANADRYLHGKYLECEFTSSVPAEIHDKVKSAIKASLS